MTVRRSARCAAAAVLLACASGFAQEIPDLGFTSRVSAALIAQYTQRFGPPTPDRLAQWIGYARAQRSADFFRRIESAAGRESTPLQGVNDAINTRVKFIDDKLHWGEDDYWATPAESIGSAGGDCEDYAIAKYYLLKELGVPISRLRITYVRALGLQGQAHMVLAYYVTPGAEPLILDNLDRRVRPASERTDLEPVYSFNDDEVELVKDGRRAKSSQIRAWLSVQNRLIAESRT